MCDTVKTTDPISKILRSATALHKLCASMEVPLKHSLYREGVRKKCQVVSPPDGPQGNFGEHYPNLSAGKMYNYGYVARYPVEWGIRVTGGTGNAVPIEDIEINHREPLKEHTYEGVQECLSRLKVGLIKEEELLFSLLDNSIGTPLMGIFREPGIIPNQDMEDRRKIEFVAWEVVSFAYYKEVKQ